jgi:adenosylcobinamide-phosphate synthase
MALALGLRLAKPGVYVLHDDGRAPQAGDTLLARRLAARALGLLILCALAALLVRAHA